MKILEPYNIVFLGDVIDRSFWGLEIACTLLILLINNPDRMHWNSGNHEDKKLNELARKTDRDKSELIRIAINFLHDNAEID